MNRNTWKSGERRIAKMFGTMRTPLSGYSSRHTHSDTLHKLLFIEIKHSKKYPKERLVEKTFKEASKEKKIPLIIFNKLHSPEPLILCRLKDLKKIIKEIK